jgi:hypothetical protein
MTTMVCGVKDCGKDAVGVGTIRVEVTDPERKDFYLVALLCEDHIVSFKDTTRFKKNEAPKQE